MSSNDVPGTEPRRFSLAGRFAALVAAALFVFALATSCIREIRSWPIWLGFDEAPAGWLTEPLPLPLAFALAGLVVLPWTLWAVARTERPLRRTLHALSDGIRSLQDRDFSVRLATDREDELGDLVRLYNRIGEILRDERSEIRERELLLQTALDRSPIAILLVNPRDAVLYANREAARLFLGGKSPVGRSFSELVRGAPAEMAEIVDRGADGLFTFEEDGGEPETYHLSSRSFTLNRREFRLYLLRRITAELSRQEAEIWKRVIRVISHELNNSLAPISSLAQSGAKIATHPDKIHKLEPLYQAIRERVDYLTRFLEGYARFARLPRPKPVPVDWHEWLEAPARMYPLTLVRSLPSVPGWFDPSQMQQVLINLLKNAVEASVGPPRIEVDVAARPDGAARIRVADRGGGMSEEVMRKALLPFYSTKKEGTGVGLPLCREIVEAHGGTIRLEARDGGGSVVTIALPGSP